MNSVTQRDQHVKPIAIRDVTAFRLGLEDGQAGRSEFDGYDLYCGWKYKEWRKGWRLGRQGVTTSSVAQ